MSITMSQLASRYAKAAEQLPEVVRDNLGRLSQVGVGLVKTEIQRAHAVDTGTMLNSTTAESDGPAAFFIGPTVGYAPYVALGTSRMAARPFHIKAASKLAEQAKSLGFTPDKIGF